MAPESSPGQRTSSAGRFCSLRLRPTPQLGGLSSCLPRLPPSCFILHLWLDFPSGKSRLQPLLRRNSLLATGNPH